MESLASIKEKRKLQQEMMAKALMQPTTIKAGENPVNAWAPVVQMIGGMVKEKKLSGQEEEAQERYRQTLAQALSPAQESPTVKMDDEGNQMPMVSRPRSTGDVSSILLQNPDTMNLGNQLLLSDIQSRSALEKQSQHQDKQHQNRLSEIGAELKGRKELAEIAGKTKIAAQGAKKGGNLSATAQKELFEADDMVNASNNAVALLNKALEFNDKAYSGLTAKARMIGSRALPGTYEGADAATELDNIMTGQALETLKATFGGMPTEGERKVLMDMQASLDKTPEQRKAIIERAIQLAKRRAESHGGKAKSLREGTYFTEQPTYSTTDLNPADFSGLSDDDFLKRRPGAVR